MRTVRAVLLAAVLLSAGLVAPAQAATSPPAGFTRDRPHLTIGHDGKVYQAFLSQRRVEVESVQLSTGAEPATTQAITGQQSYYHTYQPSSTQWTLAHVHWVEWYSANGTSYWRGLVETWCTRNSTFTACNWRHLDFCAHWGVDAHVIACKDFPGRLNKTGIEYWVGTYRDVRSTPSRIYATSSGVIQARFLAIDHLTRQYIGCSRQVDFSGSGNSWAWDCGLV